MASIKLSQIHEFALGQHLSEWGGKPYDEVMAAMRGDDKPENDYAGWEITGVVPWEPFEDALPRNMVSWISNTVYLLRGLFESAGVEVVDWE
jgi:pullulanase/glycogen debranching enzyme